MTGDNHASGRVLAALLALGSAGCGAGGEPDAYGNFEAIEVVVSAQSTGPIQRFVAAEGMTLAPGDTVALIDTTQLSLERAQALAQRGAVDARRAQLSDELRAAEAQREIAGRTLERTRRLHAGNAATQQQLDQAERDFRVLDAQLAALRSARTGTSQEYVGSGARLALLEDRLARSVVTAPSGGTVLATYAREGEMVQAGQPLVRIAALDTLELRAWVGGDQLARVALGQRVTVRVSGADGALHASPGVVTWIAGKAEFTPTPVQTRDERAELVYGIKVRVANPDGALKIGMPADVTFDAP
jgi:HlyD family secretion protein